MSGSILEWPDTYSGAFLRQYFAIPFFMQTQAMNRAPVSRVGSTAICIRVVKKPCSFSHADLRRKGAVVKG